MWSRWCCWISFQLITGRTITSSFRIPCAAGLAPSYFCSSSGWMIPSSHFASSSKPCRQIYISHNIPPKLPCRLFFFLYHLSSLRPKWGVSISSRVSLLLSYFAVILTLLGFDPDKMCVNSKKRHFFFWPRLSPAGWASEAQVGFVGPKAEEIIAPVSIFLAGRGLQVPLGCFSAKTPGREPCKLRVQAI